MKPSLSLPLVQYDTEKTPLLGLLPRLEMPWFDMSGFNMTHFVNAWDEDGGFVVVIVGLNMVKDSMMHVSVRLELGGSIILPCETLAWSVLALR
ncbi:hypothetical protein J5N97_009257 [Dioscorea zingiberensis]|uniref:Uncharacterized protein n=1 Tax=Dioscorea zingiberensis TaxID=325984 RepID=A0A9D5HM26_9LILI|nr:hypothetical protein J5N97_009257 [Dioscorea zingiberensis]